MKNTLHKRLQHWGSPAGFERLSGRILPWLTPLAWLLLAHDDKVWADPGPSAPTAGGACVGSGIGPTRVTSSLGIVKAYTTRVGAGPFPTELFDKWGEYLQTTGGEVGVNTGRKRRCGWYDSVIARYASRVNGFTDLFLTKLDVLTGIGEIPICVAYDVDGVRHDEMPITQSDFHHAVPIYETMPAWDEDISECTTFDELPQKAQDYVRRLEELSGCRISYIGVGPGRDQTIVINDVMES